MQPVEIYRLLTQQIRRGLVIFGGLRLVALTASGILVIIPSGRPWAAFAFVIGVCASLGVDHVRKRKLAAWRVAFDPTLVYWAYPIQPLRKDSHALTGVGSFSNEPILDCTLLKLHLRDDTHLEVNLPTAEMRGFTAWLAEKNPLVRWGAYDNPDIKPTDDNT